LVLGAIVAPPDAAAAVAVLGTVSLPRRTIAVLKGESLFNDAMALLLFNGALIIQTAGGVSMATAIELAVAVPGGILFGILCGFAMNWANRFLTNTLGGNILQFINAFLVWIIAERLHLSAVLAVVACAMTVARAPAADAPRMRVQSFAVWASVVFLLNVLAFLLMGMQARLIVERMSAARLVHAAQIAGLVIVGVVVVRFAVVMLWNRLSIRFARVRGTLEPPTLGQGLVVSWSGMRGLVTLAAAFALPADFPQRDLVVLTAFAVVLATLVVQGMTLAPLIRRVGLDRMEDSESDLVAARRRLAAIAHDRIQADADQGDLTMRDLYGIKSAPEPAQAEAERLQRYRALGLDVIAAQRAELARIRDEQGLDMDSYYLLQEEIDWRALTLLPDSERRINEA
jgi:CPA1 family monovalent cation:H+ antiporter